MRTKIIRFDSEEYANIQAELQEEIRERERLEAQPDILGDYNGPKGPNYEKFRKLYGMTPEQALVWCNMD